MKEVWVFRHSLGEAKGSKDFGPELGLSSKGKDLARKAAKFFFEGVDFRDIYVSPLVRSYQTGIIFSLIIKKSFPVVNYKLYSRDRRWSRTQGVTISEVLQIYPDLFQTSGADLFAEINALAGKIGENEQLLCVSHAVMIESALAKAVAELKKVPFETALIKDLKECEGAIFFFGENGFVKAEEKRL